VTSKGKIVIATVKGDVHDIGKNIVTVVLQCNNFEVINMGVMVPCHEILARAKAEGADIIGLSGLITPSLEEMQYVAGERQGRLLPHQEDSAADRRRDLLARAYGREDCAQVRRPRGLCARRLALGQRGAEPAGRGKQAYLDELSADYDKVRTQHANKKKTPLWTLEQARANAAVVGHAPVVPRTLGRRVFKNFDLAEIAQYIDWGPFFQTWDLAGPYPAILDDEVVGVEARKVLADAKLMLQKIIDGRWLQANGVMGLFPANRVGDDIVFYTDESRSQVLTTWYGMRQQTEKQAVDGPDGRPVMRPSRCLADLWPPRSRALPTMPACLP
jgi:5-methyltetrahydrofolate--homocysteine methyltransferase